MAYFARFGLVHGMRYKHVLISIGNPREVFLNDHAVKIFPFRDSSLGAKSGRLI